ncbi:hypothetical protein [Streptomyces sp. NPDC001500]
MTATYQRLSGLNITRVRTRKQVTALILASGLLTLAGCSDSGADTSSKPSSTPPSASPSPSSTVDTEDAAVIAAYTNSWDTKVDAYSQASSKGTSVNQYTTFQALADIERNLSAMRKAGQVTTGKPTIHPKVVKTTGTKILKATVTDCVDTTNWTLIDKTTKRPVPLPSQRLVKYVSTATLEKWGAKWIVTELAAQDQAC